MLRVKKPDALRKLLGVKSNSGMQPRLNERNLTKGAQETDRFWRQGGEDQNVQATPQRTVQGKNSSYQAGLRLQGGVTGAGNNTLKPYKLQSPKGVTVPKDFQTHEIPGTKSLTPVKRRKLPTNATYKKKLPLL